MKTILAAIDLDSNAESVLDAAIDRIDGIRVNGVPAESEARAFVETVALSLLTIAAQQSMPRPIAHQKPDGTPASPKCRS